MFSKIFFWRWAKLNAGFFLGLSLSRKPEKDLISSLGEALSSLRLTIGLLIVLAVVSIFGTVIPQNAPPEEYLRVYKAATYKILHILGLLDMYRSWWFVLLLSLLCLNLIACSVGRFRLTRRLLSHSPERLDDPEWKSLSPKKSLSLKGLPVDWVSSVRDGLARRFRAPKTLEEDGTVHFFAEKGKISRFGVYFVHLGVLVILGGALIGFFYGFRGNINLVEGETAGRVTLRNGGQIPLPGFKLKLEQFTVSFYSTGAPKEFKSVVTLREGDQNVRSESIRVNHPLSHKGLSFYQSSYGVAGVEKAVLAIQEKNSGKEHLVDVKMGVRIELPGGNCTPSSSPASSRTFRGMGPAFQVMSLEPNRPHENFFVLQNHPEMEDRRPGAYRFKVREIVPRVLLRLAGQQRSRRPPGLDRLRFDDCRVLSDVFSFPPALMGPPLDPREEYASRIRRLQPPQPDRVRTGFRKDVSRSPGRVTSPGKAFQRKGRAGMISSKFVTAVTFLYLFCTVLYFNYLVFRSKKLGSLAVISTWVALTLHTVSILARWIESYRLGFGHAPLSNMYESLVFFSWCITFIYLLWEVKLKTRIVGAFAMPFAFLTVAYAALSPGVSDRHRAAGPGPAEQLAHVPRHHLLPGLRRLCGRLRHLDHVPDQGAA